MSSFRGESPHAPMPHLPPRRRLLALVATAAALAAVVSLVVLVERTSSPGPAPPSPGAISTPPVQARVTLGRGRPVTVPPSFLGISTEYWTVPVWARQMKLLDRVFSMLSQDGPIRLRIGGDSADRVRWSPVRELPEWVFELTPSWLRDTGRIVRQTGVGLILDLNLVTATPASSARWASIALAKLPRGSIRAFEIGNEPDIFSRRQWLRLTAGPGVPPLPHRLTAAGYAQSYAAYANALAAVAPGVPLLAPALAEPGKNYDWVSTLIQAPHPHLFAITTHQYPYAACVKRGSPAFPTIARVLSENASARMGHTALKVEHISDRAGLPLWLTEMNSVTCGGTKGVSDTFATALWAPDALFELVRAGVESASIHVRDDAINMAFTLKRSGLIAHPLYYGMVLFARMLGPRARLIQLRLAAPARSHLKAWAVRLSGGVMHVLLINKGSRAARVRLALPFRGPATVERLTAPSVTSTNHVTLAGQHLTRAGAWAGAARRQTVASTASGYPVDVPAYSAALITARLRAGH